MAIYRAHPKCPFCGKVIAKAKYKDQSDIPMSMRLIGDTFIGWEYDNHECKEKEEFINKLPKLST